MRKHLLMLLALVWLSVTGVSAQMFTTSPAPLQQSSQNVKIYLTLRSVMWPD